MDERRTSPNDDWLAAQQKYWDAWVDLTRHTFTSPPAEQQSAELGKDALLKWWEAVSTAAPPDTRDAFDRLVGLSQPYFDMAEKFAADSTQDATSALDRWLDSMSQALGAKHGDAAPPTDSGADVALWQLPLDNWQRSMASLFPMPGEMGHAAKAEGLEWMRGSLKDRADRFLSIPGIGYTRENQEQYQRLARLNLEYQEALQAYNLAFGRVATRSIETFREAIAHSADEVGTLRRLYDLWVDVCEAAYAEYALSEEYSLLYGRLVNSLAAVKRQSSAFCDEFLEVVNLPTRREVDTMHRHIHSARRENRALRAELEHLKGRVAQGASAPPSGPRRKAEHH